MANLCVVWIDIVSFVRWMCLLDRFPLGVSYERFSVQSTKLLICFIEKVTLKSDITLLLSLFAGESDGPHDVRGVEAGDADGAHGAADGRQGGELQDGQEPQGNRHEGECINELSIA